nr:hypothetical protein HmN_001003100 [Hymenolepis microstoma]
MPREGRCSQALKRNHLSQPVGPQTENVYRHPQQQQPAFQSYSAFCRQRFGGPQSTYPIGNGGDQVRFAQSQLRGQFEMVQPQQRPLPDLSGWQPSHVSFPLDVGPRFPYPSYNYPMGYPQSMPPMQNGPQRWGYPNPISSPPSQMYPPPSVPSSTSQPPPSRPYSPSGNYSGYWPNYHNLLIRETMNRWEFVGDSSDQGTHFFMSVAEKYDRNCLLSPLLKFRIISRNCNRPKSRTINTGQDVSEGVYWVEDYPHYQHGYAENGHQEEGIEKEENIRKSVGFERVFSNVSGVLSMHEMHFKKCARSHPFSKLQLSTIGPYRDPTEAEKAESNEESTSSESEQSSQEEFYSDDEEERKAKDERKPYVKTKTHVPGGDISIQGLSQPVGPQNGNQYPPSQEHQPGFQSYSSFCRQQFGGSQSTYTFGRFSERVKLAQSQVSGPFKLRPPQQQPLPDLSCREPRQVSFPLDASLQFPDPFCDYSFGDSESMPPVQRGSRYWDYPTSSPPS